MQSTYGFSASPSPIHASKMQLRGKGVRKGLSVGALQPLPLGVLVAWSINYVDRKMHVWGINFLLTPIPHTPTG